MIHQICVVSRSLSVSLSPLCLSVSLCIYLSLTVTHSLLHLLFTYITDNTENVCIGSDPHFAIRLHEGSLLCYSFQGKQNSTFNIISNKQLEMNALFVPDSRQVDSRQENNTLIGSIGITIYHEGRKMSSLTLTAADQMIRLGSGVELRASSVTVLF